MSKKKLSKLLALYLPYVAIGLLATNLGEAWRLAVGKELGDKIVSLMDTLPAAFSNPLPSLHPFDLFIGLCCGAGMRLAVYLKGKNAKKYRHGMEYGSARWGTPKDIEPFMAPKFADNIILTKTERLMMSNRPPDPKNARNKNVLVVGGSGSGKTRFFIKPNLLQCDSKNFPVSFVVTDPKGSIGVECGEALLKHGYKLKFFNTINFSKSMRYNPMAYIHSEKDVLKLVTALMTNTKGEGQGGDPFWDKAERLLLVSLIAYLHYEAPVEEQNFATLLEMLNTMQVSEDDETYQNPVDLLFEDLGKKKPNSFAVRQYKLYKLAAGKTARSILISCGARMAPFDIQEVRDATMYDELELDKLGDRKTALFLIMSDTDSTFNFLISMIYTQLFNLLCDKADDQYGGKLPVHVRCLIDECANIGQIPQLEKLVATIRSREISACLVLQTRSQLKAIYKDNADTIVGNMDSQIFLGGSEPTTLKDLAEALGKETIDSYNNSDTRGNSPSYGTNYQKLGHDFRVDHVNFMFKSVSLQDMDLTNSGQPIFRVERLPNIRELYEQQQDEIIDVSPEKAVDYKVGDEVVVDLPTRTIEGKIGYVGETDVRIDTSAHGQSWDNEVLNKQQFEDGLRRDEPTPDEELDKLPISVEVNGEWQTFPDAAAADEALNAEPMPEAAGNFHITDDNLGVGGPKQKFARNIEAIQTLRTLEQEHRGATAEEQQVLSQYVGWGGLADAFDPGKDSWAKEYAELKGLLSEDEYAAARSSTLNAHYTSPVVIRAMVYDDKKAAGERLLLARQEMPNADMMLLGTYRGFELNIRFDSFKNEHQAVLRAELSYPVSLGDDARGNITRLDNAI